MPSIPGLAVRRHWCAGLISLSVLHGCTESDDEHSLSAPREVQPAPVPPKAPEGRRSGGAVTYTVARGGTLLNVANLYKLHHHEIVELNPDIPPDRQLPPRTEVVVYDSPNARSESVGLPHDGSIVGAIPMLEGPGRRITAERWKTWATRDTVRQLDRVLRRWAGKYSKGPVVLVGNLSARKGGPLSPHKTHQSGRDVDLSYIAKWDGESRVTWQKMNSNNLDARKTWDLIRMAVDNSDVEVIFVDRNIQKLLYDFARANDYMRVEQLKQWLEVAPGAQRGQTLIAHVPGHDDHMHVRFACPSNSRRCRS